MNIDNKTANWLSNYVKVAGTHKIYDTKSRQFLRIVDFDWDLDIQLCQNGNTSEPANVRKAATKTGLIPTMTVDEIDELNQDTVYRFANLETYLFFVGTREQLCEAYNLDADKVANMIKHPRKIFFHSWAVSGRNVKGLETSDMIALCELTRNAKEVVLQLPHVIDINKWTGGDEPILNTICGWCPGGDSTANDVAKGMIDHGANINGKDYKGRTALMVAMLHDKKTQLIKTLISSGADVHAKDKDGNTAWDYMQKNRSLIGTNVYRELQSLQHAA